MLSSFQLFGLDVGLWLFGYSDLRFYLMTLSFVVVCFFGVGVPVRFGAGCFWSTCILHFVFLSFCSFNSGAEEFCLFLKDMMRLNQVVADSIY